LHRRAACERLGAVATKKKAPKKSAAIVYVVDAWDEHPDSQ
jgi:hypothetical protein